MQYSIYFVLFYHILITSVTALNGNRNNDNNLITLHRGSAYTPPIHNFFRTGVIGYNCMAPGNTQVFVPIQKTKAALTAACNLSKDELRLTDYPRSFIPVTSQTTDFISTKYYLYPAHAELYANIFLLMTKECRLAGLMTTMGHKIEGLPLLTWRRQTMQGSPIKIRPRGSFKRLSKRTKPLLSEQILSCKAVMKY
ncbi:hypothetical protein HI914_02423 [Erysiphe necator]|nr:hypothetical protein HI914_02423 [Erysiphe necator]